MHSLSHLKDSIDFTKINWLTLLKAAAVFAAFFIFSWSKGSLCFTDMRLMQAEMLLDCIGPFLALIFLFSNKRLPFSLGLVIAAPFWLFSFFTPISVALAALFSYNKLTRVVGGVILSLLSLLTAALIYSYFAVGPMIERTAHKKVGSKTVAQYKCQLFTDDFQFYDLAVETPVIPGIVLSKGIDEFETIDADEFEVVDDNHIRFLSDGEPKTALVD